MTKRKDEIQAEPLYKWLTADGRTAVQNVRWPEGAGEWTKPEKPVLCQSGWHAMYEKDVLTHLPTGTGAKLWRVEVRGAVVEGDDKIAAESMRLLYCVGETTDSNLRLFACDVAEDALSLVESPDPRSLAAIEVARRYAVRAASRDELAAARDAAWDAALAATRVGGRHAAWDAARAAARAAALDAAQDATWDAAGAATWDAAGAATWDAAGAATWAAARAATWAAELAAARDAAWDAAWERYSNWLVVRLESGY